MFLSKLNCKSRIDGSYMRLKSAGTRFDSVGLHHIAVIAKWKGASLQNLYAKVRFLLTAPYLFLSGDLGERAGLLNRIKAGSNPAAGAIFLPPSSKGRTSDFESDNCGSNPRGGTKSF